jgi:hypothetical protein
MNRPVRPAQEAPVSPFWIDFEEARNAVETIVDVAHDDQEERPTCIVLVGQSGMGKTSILREARRRLTEDFPEPAGWGEPRYQPVLRLVIPSSPTSLKINLALLWKQGWPIKTSTHKTADLKVVDLLSEQGTRLVAIDNVHVILTASGVARPTLPGLADAISRVGQRQLIQKQMVVEDAFKRLEEAWRAYPYVHADHLRRRRRAAPRRGPTKLCRRLRFCGDCRMPCFT